MAAMGACKMAGPDGPVIESVKQMVGLFFGEISERVPVWKRRLLECPDQLEALEREVRTEFIRGADMVVAGVLAVVLMSPGLEAASEQTRRHFKQPLARGRNRSIKVRLLGGFVMWITSLYCEPKRGLFRPKDETATGLYVELAQFGFGKGITPGLQSLVARQAAICPSLQMAQEELERGGLKLNVKAVRRITNQCGEDLLKLRKAQLMQWRAGKLPAGQEFKGKCVTVQIDGGRTKIRKALRKATPPPEPLNAEGLVIQNAPGRSKPKSKKTFDSEWREPKLLTIFVHDEHGRMAKKNQAVIDGTFAGPDATAELVAMHLHRLGAAEALSVTFVSDGATWIWDRIDRIVSQAKIPETVKIHQVLDNCHASHHISMALAALGLSDKERMPLYREHRTLVRNGQWRRVVDELAALAAKDLANSAVQTEIEYLRKHGAAGRLSYPHFRSQGIPIGSGAIESSIRRVINLRLKNNGTFWLESNAEIMLQLRATVISGRWDERLKEVRAMNRSQAEPDWHWTPQPMSCKSEAEVTAPT